jgi:hypothetical protein
MTEDQGGSQDADLTAEQARWLDQIGGADTLTELQRLIGAESEHDAYVEVKPTWETLRDRKLGEPPATDGLPGDSVLVDGQRFHVHGITHADTDAEANFLRGHVTSLLDGSAAVFCEQGIRPMYFDDIAAVAEIDDYRWAMHHCRERDISSHIDGIIEESFEEGSSVTGNVMEAATEFRDVAFSLIESGSDLYGETFAAALGDVASTFFMDHEHLATAEDFESFELSEAAAENPERLAALQQYYKRVFLPQPLEREWLRRHDPELELFTHARNERMAAYVLSHATGTEPVHLVVGAAHQPGVIYYLSAYRDGEWDYGEFEMVP